MKKLSILKLGFVFVMSGFLPTVVFGSEPSDFKNYVFEPLPAWSDSFKDFSQSHSKRLDIRKLMDDFKLTRAQANELQKQLHDTLRESPTMDSNEAFAMALKSVKKGNFENLDISALQKADFIIAFDLDDTIYDQGVSVKNACAQSKFIDKKGRKRAIYYDPNALKIIKKVRALGGAVVIYSAAEDKSTLENLEHWKDGQKSVLGLGIISGVLTNGHLMQSRNEKDVLAVREPSKDLRMLNDSLKKVIIIDDNPVRLFQPRNLRLVKKLHGDTACEASDPLVRKMLNSRFEVVAKEIEESSRYMKKHDVDFAQAFLPYSMMGALTVQSLIETTQVSRAQAIEFVRRNPTLVEQAF